MDVKRFTQSARPSFLALALFLGQTFLGQASLATAEVAIASDSETTPETSTTIFISDDTPPSLPSSAKGSAKASAEGSVVFVDDTPAQAPAVARTTINRATINRATLKMLPATPEPEQAKFFPPVAHGELKVVSNQQKQAAALKPLSAISVREQPNVQREQPGDIQIAVHSEPTALETAPFETVSPETVSPTTTTSTMSPTADAASVADLLISAHQISLEAKTVADYSQIEQECAAAIELGAKGDQRGFARQLSSWALNRRGQLRSDAGNQDLADADFLASLESNPRNWRAMHNRGVSFAQSGKFAEAFDDFNEVIQLNPEYAKAYANRATLYVQAKDLQAAVNDYEQAIQIDNQFATAHVGLGRVCHMLSRWDEAIEHYTAAVELEPTSADIFCSRGDLQADRGHYGEALADYARTIELDHEFAHAYRNGAWLLATCPDESFRDPENAVLGAQQALECSYGERHIALDTLAAALASNGQFKEAITTVTQAVDLAPEDAKYTYLTRLQLYQASKPFLTEPVGDVSQAGYNAE